MHFPQIAVIVCFTVLFICLLAIWYTFRGIARNPQINPIFRSYAESVFGLSCAMLTLFSMAMFLTFKYTTWGPL